MADEIIRCDGTDPIHVPDWDKVVGEKTILDGGRVGDLLTITRVHLEDAKEKGELREEDAGAAYATAIMESMKSAIMFELGYPKSQLEVCYLQAQIDKLICDCNNDTTRTDSQVELNAAQIEKLECDCMNDTRKTDSQISLNSAQEDKLECDCKNDTLMTDSKVSLNAAQENKLACDCCNDSARTTADVAYREQQIEKSICDCDNSTLIGAAQTQLYARQAKGFDDNAKQKLYDSQLQAWSMVFADAELEQVTTSIKEPYINNSYATVANGLGAGQTGTDANGNPTFDQPDENP